MRIEEPAEAIRSALGAQNGILSSSQSQAVRPDRTEQELSVLGANHALSGLVWESAESGFLLGQAYAKLGQSDAAVKTLDEIIALQARIGDPRLSRSKELLQNVRGRKFTNR